MGKKIACVGDMSDHGGTITVPGQTTVLAGGVPVAVMGAIHSCPIPGHGDTPIVPITVKSMAGGMLIVTENAVAGCGAKIIGIDRKVEVE